MYSFNNFLSNNPLCKTITASKRNNHHHTCNDHAEADPRAAAGASQGCTLETEPEPASSSVTSS